MADEREQILQTAQTHVDRQEFDQALQQYARALQTAPNDTRVLLKLGDIQARTGNFDNAITTYNNVAAIYHQQGFALKSVAVYKQVRELVRVHAPHQVETYNRVVVTLTQLYAELGLVNDALSMLDEEATRLRDANAEEQAIMVYRRMVEVGPGAPLPHLRLAEGLCRQGDVDSAMESFWAAAQLLMSNQRPDDALRVIERMLHFQQEPKYAKIAAKIYLEKGTEAEAMQALSRLQICFQSDPKDLETLQLLAQAFHGIGQEPKAFEVQKEIVRQAHEQNQPELFHATLQALKQQAPDDEQVRALTQLPPPPSQSASHTAASSAAPGPTIIPGSAPAAGSAPPAGSAPAAGRASAVPPPLPPGAFGVPISSAPPGSISDPPEPIPLGGPPPPPPPPPEELAPDPMEARADAEELLELEDMELVEDSVVEPVPAAVPQPAHAETEEVDIRLHTRRALVDAQTFRELRLFDKAIETIQVALEFDPRSIELRELLRDVYAESGDREGAIEEMLTMAAIYIEYDHPQHARTVLLNVLEAEPDHALARRTLVQLGEPLPAPPSVPVSPLPSFSNNEAPEEADLELDDQVGTVEEALEESEFFCSRGMYQDARLILTDQLNRTPGHPLLLEALEEVEEALAGEKADPGKQGEGSEFDLQASLEELERVVRESQRPPAPGAATRPSKLDVENVFEKFKAGVREQVADSDSATHYDLGIAYKDMNLIEDAISEFELAARDPARECKCYAMIGMLNAERENWLQARTAYERALAATQKTEQEELTLHYDLATAFEHLGQEERAISSYEQVVRRDADYRDAQDRIDALRSERPSKTGDELDRAFAELLGD